MNFMCRTLNVHEHKYELHVQDFEADKYFVALRVCICGDSKAGELNILLTNAAGETVQLVPNEYGQADYADLYGDWLVTITDMDGAQLTMFDLSAGEAPEEPTEPEDPDEGEVPDDGGDTPENPDAENPDDGNEGEMPEEPDEGNEGETPENPDEPSDETKGNGDSGTAVVLLIVFILLVAGGIGAVIFLKKRKNKNQN